MLPVCFPKRCLEDTPGSRAAPLLWVSQRRSPESAPIPPRQRVLTPVFLMLPPLATVAVSLGDCHGVALSTSAHATRRLMAITVLETLRQYLLGPSGQVSMALLYFLGKWH